MNATPEGRVDLSPSSDDEVKSEEGGDETEPDEATLATSQRLEAEAHGLAQQLAEEVKYDLESLRCAVPPTNLLVSIENNRWVLSTVQETEQEVMLVMAERTLILYRRDTQPESLYEPLTKDEVAGLLKTLEVRYTEEVSWERKQVCSQL